MTNLIEDAAETAANVPAPAEALPAKVTRWLFGDVRGFIGVMALLAIGAQTARINGVYLRPHIGAVGVILIDLPGWKPRAQTAERALAEVKTAQPKAAAAQATVNHQPAVISAAIAKASDHDAEAYYSRGRAVGAAYAVAHPAGGLCAPGAQGSSSGTNLPGGDHPAPQHDGPGETPDRVAIPRADFDQFVANSLRLAKVHQDAESLIAAGVALPETSLPIAEKD